jgi:hypothetical protein
MGNQPSMGEPERIPDERAASLAAWSPEAAEAFRSLAADHGFDLDYSPESLADVERLITEKFSGRGGKPKKRWRDLSGTSGAYVAEVILRNIGGTWGFQSEFQAGGIQLPSGTWVFPLHKSRKRYEDGPGDDFVSYYSVIADGEADGW